MEDCTTLHFSTSEISADFLFQDSSFTIIIDENDIIQFTSKSIVGLSRSGDHSLVGEDISKSLSFSESILEAIQSGDHSKAPMNGTLSYKNHDSLDCSLEIKKVPAGLALDIKMSEASEINKAHLIRVNRLEMASAMSSLIAHDLNNLLAVVMGRVSLSLRSGRGSENSHNLMDLLVRASEMVGIAMKPFKNNGEKIVEVASTIENMLPFLKATAMGTAEVEFKKPSNQFIVSDPCGSNSIQHVVYNLVANAVQSMNVGHSGKISISANKTTHKYSDQEMVEISVSDNGPGIPADVLPTLFVPSESTKDGHSCGVGLYMTMIIIKDMGGYIDVITGPDTGTIFKVMYPTQSKTPHNYHPLALK